MLLQSYIPPDNRQKCYFTERKKSFVWGKKFNLRHYITFLEIFNLVINKIDFLCKLATFFLIIKMIRF